MRYFTLSASSWGVGPSWFGFGSELMMVVKIIVDGLAKDASGISGRLYGVYVTDGNTLPRFFNQFPLGFRTQATSH